MFYIPLLGNWCLKYILIWSQSMVFKWHCPEILENYGLSKNDKFPRRATGQLPLNTAKCNVMHIGATNNMGDQRLEVITEERDLGLLVDKSLLFHAHTATSVTKTFRTLGIIRRTFLDLNETTVIQSNGQGRRIRGRGVAGGAAAPPSKIMEGQNYLFAPPSSKSYLCMSRVVTQYIFMYD